MAGVIKRNKIVNVTMSELQDNVGLIFRQINSLKLSQNIFDYMIIKKNAIWDFGHCIRQILPDFGPHMQLKQAVSDEVL